MSFRNTSITIAVNVNAAVATAACVGILVASAPALVVVAIADASIDAIVGGVSKLNRKLVSLKVEEMKEVEA